MEALVNRLRRDYPDFTFTIGSVAHWSPATKQVIYTSGGASVETWALFHELAHALLGHASYESDVSLLQKETAAWETAVLVARRYGEIIHDEHIQDCLDTYRDWLHKRSTCPVCESHGVQPSEHAYTCLNCHNTWEVTSARFCRPYRRKSTLTAK